MMSTAEPTITMTPQQIQGETHWKNQFTREELRSILSMQDWRAVRTLVVNWSVIFACFALVGWSANPFTIVFAIFGGMFATSIPIRTVTGPVQVSFADSLHVLVDEEVTITRASVTSRDEKATKDATMGRQYITPYAVFASRVFINPTLATRTGFSREDLADVEEAMSDRDIDVYKSNLKTLDKRKKINNGAHIVEAIILAHAIAGINVETPSYQEGIETVTDKIANNM